MVGEQGGVGGLEKRGEGVGEKRGGAGWRSLCGYGLYGEMKLAFGDTLHTHTREPAVKPTASCYPATALRAGTGDEKRLAAGVWGAGRVGGWGGWPGGRVGFGQDGNLGWRACWKGWYGGPA